MPSWLTEDKQSFPAPKQALEDPDGLLALGGDLSVERLLAAYSQGIFPWYSDDEPILWWSPNPRTLIFFDEFHASKSLLKVMKTTEYDIKLDDDFEQVVEACRQPRAKQKGTWITDDMKQAYINLFNQGYAHCISVHKNGKLWGGLYGVSLGHAFFGESMFSNQDNGSKVAMFHLIEHLKNKGFSWIDCQVWSDHLGTLGARTIAREAYLIHLKTALKEPTIQGKWHL